MADDEKTTTADEKDDEQQPLIPVKVADPNRANAPFPGPHLFTGMSPTQQQIDPALEAHPLVAENQPLVPAPAPAVRAPTSAPPINMGTPAQPAPPPPTNREQPFNPAAPVTREQAEEQVNPWLHLEQKEKGIQNPVLRGLARGITIAGAGAEGLGKNYPEIAASREAAAERLQQQPLQWAAKEQQGQNIAFNQGAKERELSDTEKKNAEEQADKLRELTDAEGKPAKEQTPAEQVFASLEGQTNPATGKPYTDQERLAAIQEQPKPAKENPIAGTVNGKPTYGVYDPAGKQWTSVDGKPLPGFAPPPNYAQAMLPTKTTKLLGPDGVDHLYQWDPATNSYSTDLGAAPTGAAAHSIFQAQNIGELGPKLIGDINADRDMLGNLESYYKQWTAGTPIADPRAAGLMSELMSFAAMQPAMHGFRSSSAMESFEKLIGGLAKDPDATIASINGILKTAGTIASTVPKRAEAEPERPAKVPKNYTYKANGPQGAGWYKPKGE